MAEVKKIAKNSLYPSFIYKSLQRYLPFPVVVISRVMADRYCLLMDECISSSDDVRKQGIFEVLEAMKKVFPQIFVIAHEDISDFVDNHIVLTRNDDGYSEIRSRSWPNVLSRPNCSVIHVDQAWEKQHSA